MNIQKLAKSDGLTLVKANKDLHCSCPGCLAVNSLVISDNQSRYYCQHCNKRGDAIQYLRDFHGLSYKAACHRLGIPSTENSLTQLWRPFFSERPSGSPSVLYELASKFSQDCQARLLGRLKLLKKLYSLGLTQGTIEHFCLGWNVADKALDTSKNLPEGLVIPIYDQESHQLQHLKIITATDESTPVYIQILGRTKASIYGNSAKPMFVVKTDIEAMLLYQIAGDICCPIVLRQCQWPDKYLDNNLRKSPLIVFTTDKVDFTWWSRRYAPCIYRRLYKSITLKNSSNVRSWALEVIRSGLSFPNQQDHEFIIPP